MTIAQVQSDGCLRKGRALLQDLLNGGSPVLARRAWGSVFLFWMIGASAAGIGEARRDLYPTGFAEEHTVALWLFDEPNYLTMLLTDAGLHYWDLRLETEAASLEPGRFGNALTLSPAGGLATYWARNVPARNSRLVTYDHSPRQLVATLAGSDWTLEFWIRVAAMPTQDVVILEMGAAQQPHTTLFLSAGGGPLVFQGELPPVELHCPVNNRVLTDRQWHHLAFVYDSSKRQMRHWFDGEPQIEAMPKGSTGTDQRVEEQVTAVDTAAKHRGYVLSFGRSVEGKKPFNGQIDELRFSDIIRYQYKEPFTPQTHSRNWSRSSRPSEPDGPPLLFGANAATGAIQMGSRKHVFIDEVLVENKTHVLLTLNRPYESKSLKFELKQPWDSEVGIDTFYDWERRVRAVYYNGGLWKKKQNIVSLADSTDGINFGPVPTGTVEWQGSTENNILTTYPGQGTWLVDPNPQCPAEEKVKWFSFGMERAVHVFVSPDGIHLKRNETVGVFSDVGGGVEGFWDDQRGKYIVHLRHEGFLRGMRGADGRRKHAPGPGTFRRAGCKRES